ncbi:hypothetical protein ACWDVX_41100, partial [Streptomyces tendae]
ARSTSDHLLRSPHPCPTNAPAAPLVTGQPLAVVVFFWRNPGLPHRSPVLGVALVSLVLMTSVTAVLIRYTDILTGAGRATNAVLVGLVFVVLLLGFLRPAPRFEE